jgi:hypothetical protein
MPLMSLFVLTAQSIEERPSWRVRVNPAKSGSSAKGVLFKKSRDCLGEHMIMPLDALYKVSGVSCF